MGTKREFISTQTIPDYIDIHSVCRICLEEQSEMHEIRSKLVDDDVEQEFVISDLLETVSHVQVDIYSTFVKK